MEIAFMQQWNLRLLSGPVQPSAGFFSLWPYMLHRLAFCDEGLIAIPSKFSDSLILGAAAGTGKRTVMRKANDMLGAKGKTQQAEILNDDGNPKWHRYPVGEIEEIVAQSSTLGRHQIIIEPKSGKRMSYGVMIRDDWDTYCRLLKKLYKDLLDSDGD
jgi:hypothetical protein